MAIVHDPGEVQTVVARASQRELKKRELGLVDTSNCLVRLTLWAEEAINFEGENNPVIVAKSAKVSDFHGMLGVPYRKIYFTLHNAVSNFVVSNHHRPVSRESVIYISFYKVTLFSFVISVSRQRASNTFLRFYHTFGFKCAYKLRVGPFAIVPA